MKIYAIPIEQAVELARLSKLKDEAELAFKRMQTSVLSGVPFESKRMAHLQIYDRYYGKFTEDFNFVFYEDG